MDSKEALNTLYNATRQLSVNAETHEQLNKLYTIVFDALETPLKEEVKDE